MKNGDIDPNGAVRFEASAQEGHKTNERNETESKACRAKMAFGLRQRIEASHLRRPSSR